MSHTVPHVGRFEGSIGHTVAESEPWFDEPAHPLISRATTTELSDEETAAYDAPFPDDSYKGGARIFPSLVPTSVDDPAAEANRAAWEIFKKWDKPFITCFSGSDPVTAGDDKPFLALVPGAEGQPHVTIRSAAHFFQEDAAPELAQILIEALS